MSSSKECGIFFGDDGKGSYSVGCIKCPLDAGFSLNGTVYGRGILAQRKRQIQETHCRNNKPTTKPSTS